MKIRSACKPSVRKQRGVALITAVLMVALATILAVQVGHKAYLDQRRAMTLYAIDQGYEVALGAEAWAADALMADLQADPNTTHFAQRWATPLPTLPIDGGEISGQLEDVSGRFNLNQLVAPVDPNFPKQKKAHEAAIAQFKRLLVLADIEETWADKIIDWLDIDTDVTFPDGAEDDVYTAQKPGYRAANRQITRVSELLSLPEFGYERYRKLEPLVTALPTDSALNLCTAPGLVLDSFSSKGQTQFSHDANFLAEQRKSSCFPDVKTLSAAMSEDEDQVPINDPAITDVKSSYFRATIVVTIGTNQFTLYSLLKRGPTGVRSIARSFGTT